jgi:hypothetical protein
MSGSFFRGCLAMSLCFAGAYDWHGLWWLWMLLCFVVSFWQVIEERKSEKL